MSKYTEVRVGEEIFDRVVRGEQSEVYLDIKKHWTEKIYKVRPENITLKTGAPGAGSRSIDMHLLSLKEGIGDTGWGAKPGVDQYILSLRPIVELDQASGQEADREITTFEHDVDLMDYELVEIGAELHALEIRKGDIELKKKAAMSEFNSRLRDIESQQKGMISMLGSKKRHMSTDCYIEPDYSAGKMVYLSVETGEVIESRDMTRQERQMKITDMKMQDGGELNSEGLKNEE